MGQLKFDKVINLTTLDSNPAPKYVDKLMIGNEPNNDIYQYYLTGAYLQDKSSHVVLANYDLTWGDPSASISTRPCIDFGMKTFPGEGAVAYYTPVGGSSRMLLPIHAKQKQKYAAPTLTMTESSGNLIFTIKNPKSITYACHRILLENGYNALEYVTYDLACTVPKPTENGTYRIYCIGYVDEGSYVSEESNAYSLTVTGGTAVRLPKAPSYASVDYVSQLEDKVNELLRIVETTQ